MGRWIIYPFLWRDFVFNLHGIHRFSSGHGRTQEYLSAFLPWYCTCGLEERCESSQRFALFFVSFWLQGCGGTMKDHVCYSYIECTSTLVFPFALRMFSKERPFLCCRENSQSSYSYDMWTSSTVEILIISQWMVMSPLQKDSSMVKQLVIIVYDSIGPSTCKTWYHIFVSHFLVWNSLGWCAFCEQKCARHKGYRSLKGWVLYQGWHGRQVKKHPTSY